MPTLRRKTILQVFTSLVCVQIRSLYIRNSVDFFRSRRSFSSFNQLSSEELIQIYKIDESSPYPRLNELVNKHLDFFGKYRQSTNYAAHTIAAFQAANDFVNIFYQNSSSEVVEKYVILDSGCGVGLSSIQLAADHPNTPVIGIDRSIHRLKKSGVLAKNEEEEEQIDNKEVCFTGAAENLLLVRAELSDFWMLAMEHSDWIVTSHFILYANPYPKNKHVQRRWHGGD